MSRVSCLVTSICRLSSHTSRPPHRHTAPVLCIEAYLSFTTWDPWANQKAQNSNQRVNFLFCSSYPINLLKSLLTSHSRQIFNNKSSPRRLIACPSPITSCWRHYTFLLALDSFSEISPNSNFNTNGYLNHLEPLLWEPVLPCVPCCGYHF